MSNNYSVKKAFALFALLFVFNLQAQECTAPIGLVTGGVGMTHARFYWSVPQTLPSQGYDWQLTLTGEATVLQSGTVQSATILTLNLTAETAYTLQLRAHCAESLTSSWIEHNFTTKGEFTTQEGQIGAGADANPLFDGTYGPMLYPLTAQRNGSVANMLFTQAEMQGTGIPTGANITGVAFEKLNATYGGDAYPDLRMRLFAKNSTATAPLSTETTFGDIINAHTEVSDNPAYDLQATIGWINFPFEDTFQYTGGSFEFATAMYQNGQTAQFSNFVIWQYTAGYKDYLVGAWPINTVPMDENLVLNHMSGSGQYKNRPNIKVFYEVSNIPTAINVVAQGNVLPQITQNGGTLQLVAPIAPSYVSQEKTWHIVSGAEFATLSANGLVTATANGTVTVQATSADNAAVNDTIEISITNQIVAVNSLEITVADNAPAAITTDDGTLQLIATVLPSNSNQNVVWSTISGNAFAYVLPNGIVTAINNGTAVIQAVSAEDSTILDTIEVTITNQIVTVNSLEITVADNAPAAITTDDGTLQLIATVLPSNSNQNVVWSTISGNASAYVLPNGIVTAINNGTAVIQAVSAEDSTILDTIEVTITNQIVAVNSLTISVENDAAPVITTGGGTLQLIATVLPSNSVQSVVWSTISGNAFAYVMPNGVVTAIGNGTATIQAVSTEDNTVSDTIEITITGVLGLGDYAKEDIIIYPNPAKTQLTIQSPSEVGQVTIYNMLGQEVLEQKGGSINIGSLAQGSYMIMFELANGQSFTRRIIKE